MIASLLGTGLHRHDGGTGVEGKWKQGCLKHGKLHRNTRTAEIRTIEEPPLGPKG